MKKGGRERVKEKKRTNRDNERDGKRDWRKERDEKDSKGRREIKTEVRERRR